MRRLLVFALVAGAAWWLLSRRCEHGEHVVIGYEDGTSVDAEPRTAARDDAIALVRGVLRA